jgi:hypothetical protein
MIVLIALLAVLLPRLTMVCLFLFTNWFASVFPNVLWPVLGFIFLPLTTLWYSVVVNWFGGEWGVLPILVAVIAVLIDISPITARRRQPIIEEV